MYKFCFLRVAAAILFSLCLGAGCSKSSASRTEPYVIAYPSTWEQIRLYGSEQSVVGFTSDLIYEIAKRAGFQTRMVMGDPDAFPAMLESGKVDAVITAEPSNPVNDQFYEFSEPYFVGGTVVVVPANSPFTNTDELKNVEIAYDRSEGLDLALGVKTTWIFKPYDNTTEALDAMLVGKADGMVLHYIRARQLSKSLYRNSIKILMPPLIKRTIRLAVRKGKNHDLIALFNKGVESYLKSGEYKELLEYWGIDSQLPIDNK
jgi:polar amino acid transport system substrate-binding protein